MTQKPYDYLEWNSEKIASLWNFASQWPPYEKEYFSRMVGKGIINFLEEILSIKGNVLDFGCGPGYLVQHLLEREINCEGADFSEESIISINTKFKQNSFWRGAKLYSNGKLPFPDNSYDLVICVETIEHLMDTDLNIILSEFHRILKPKIGQLFITTPNNEDLSISMVFCPQCQQIFHKYQHIRSFSMESLFEFMKHADFSTDLCNSTNFNYFQEREKDQIIRILKDYVQSFISSGDPRTPSLPNNRYANKAGFRFNRQIGHGPHLFWLGKKIE